MERSRRQLLAAGGLGLCLATADALRRLGRAPTFAVRDRPALLRAGLVHAAAPAGQRLRLPRGELRAVEWTVLGRPDPDAPPRTRVVLGERADGPWFEAPCETRGGPDGTHRLRARFDPPLAVDDGPLRIDLLPPRDREHSAVSPVLRVHAAPGSGSGLGRARFDPPRAVRLLRTDHDHWTALAIPFVRLPPGAGPVELTVARLAPTGDALPYGPQPMADAFADVPSTVVRRVRLERPSSLDLGHLVLPLEPLAETRGALFRLELTLPAGAQVAGDASGFACLPFHGALRPRPPWLAAVVGGAELEHASLALAVWHR